MPGAVEQFFRDRREIGDTKPISVRAADPMLRYLRGLGFIADTTPPVRGDPVEEIRATLADPVRGLDSRPDQAYLRDALSPRRVL